MKKSVILVSGGMDSLACIEKAKAVNNASTEDLYFLHLNYGQKTQKKELACFNDLKKFYKIPDSRAKIIDMTFLSQIGGSSLTDEKINVSKNSADFEGIPSSYVPFRNTHILAMATSWAEVISAKLIYIGAVLQDHMGYPDCRPSYYQAFNELIKQGTKLGDIEVVTPIIDLTKTEILTFINTHKAPIHLTWSCYENSDTACGECDSCVLRLGAFKELNLKDPIKY